jgi:hypothetical protein
VTDSASLPATWIGTCRLAYSIRRYHVTRIGRRQILMIYVIRSIS